MVILVMVMGLWAYEGGFGDDDYSEMATLNSLLHILIHGFPECAMTVTKCIKTR